MPADDSKQRHRGQMQRKKATIDATIAAAGDERGLLLINTGNGKGKSSAAFGVLARALGHGLRCAVIQFVKSRSNTGEASFFRQSSLVHWHVTGVGFTWEAQDHERDLASVRSAWDLACTYLRDPSIALVVLDEFAYAIKYRWLSLDEVMPALRGRPHMQHVVLTGRNVPDALVAIADTVTEMSPKKHAFQAGVKAMRGIEW
jgi:cob(I)alamin adenosyltransferase